MTETEREVAEQIKASHEGESEHEIGKRIDSFFGHFRKFEPRPEPISSPPKEFPAKALRDRPGEAPLIERE